MILPVPPVISFEISQSLQNYLPVFPGSFRSSLTSEILKGNPAKTYPVHRHNTVLCSGKILHSGPPKVLFVNGHECHYIVGVGIGYLSCPYRYLFLFPVYDANTGRGIKYEFVLRVLKKYTNKFDFVAKYPFE